MHQRLAEMSTRRTAPFAPVMRSASLLLALLLSLACAMGPSEPPVETGPTEATQPAADEVASSLALPTGWSDQRSTAHGGSVYVWTQWPASRWSDVEPLLGASRDRFAHVSRPARPLPQQVETALFPAGHPYESPLNTVGYPHLLRHDWPVDGVQWAMVLPDGALLVRVDGRGPS